MSDSNIEGSGFYVVSSFSEQNSYYFSGTMFNDESIIIGERGLGLYLQNNDFPDLDSPLDGRFSLIKITTATVFARTDIFGQDILYYYIRNGEWAISNSFFLLTKHLEKHGKKLHLDYDQVKVLRIKHGVTQQLISNDTLIHEIKVVPRDKVLLINKVDTSFEFKKISTNFHDKSYCDLLDSYYQRIANINYTLIDYFEKRVTIDVTGGVDSRAVLATVLSSGVDLSKINFVSGKEQSKDFEIALSLAEKFGFEITNKSYVYGHGSQEELYDLWKFGNLGVYFPVYFPTSARPQSLIHYHGGCGECIRGTDAFYMLSADTYIEEVSKGQKNDSLLYALNRKFGKALDNIDALVNEDESMLYYFWDFRSRFHFGRNTVRSLSEFCITPLASVHLLSAFEKLDNIEKKGGALVLDIFMKCYPDLLTISFDRDDKNYSEVEINESLKRINGLKQNRNIKVPNKLEVFYELEARKQKTDRKKSMVDFLVSDLEKYSKIVVDANLFTFDDVQAAMNAIKKSSWNPRIGINASKIISVGELISLKNVKS